MGTTKEPILELKNVKTTFKVPKGILKAVNGVDLTIYKGETVGLVGVTFQHIIRIQTQ